MFVYPISCSFLAFNNLHGVGILVYVDMYLNYMH